jgi:hypothetical protein
VTCASDRARLAAALATIVALGSPASATPADDAFQKGRDLMKAGKYAEACTAFAESQRLDPSLGTQFNIAQCEEKTGKLASALKIYRDLAQYDTNGTRKAAAADLAAKLEPRVPKLQIQLSAKPPGTQVRLDDVECAPCLTGNVPVDFGTISVVVSAPGYQIITTSASVTEEARVIVVPLRLDRLGTDPAVAAPPPVEIRPNPTPYIPPPARSLRKTYAVITLVGGAVVLGTGVVFGVKARTRWQEAKDVCGGSTTCANDDDTQYAQEVGDSAGTLANVSTVMFVAGGLVAAAGVYLWVTAPKEHAVTVSATATPGAAGIVLGGRF